MPICSLSKRSLLSSLTVAPKRPPGFLFFQWPFIGYNKLFLGSVGGDEACDGPELNTHTQVSTLLVANSLPLALLNFGFIFQETS